LPLTTSNGYVAASAHAPAIASFNKIAAEGAKLIVDGAKPL